MSFILSFDSSNQESSVALFKDGQLLCEESSSQNFQHAEFLLPAIEKVLKAENIWYNDLNLVATCKGPGSFSGVRVALSVAKSIKIASNIPVIAFDSSHILAFQYSKSLDFTDIAILLRAATNGFYFASYKKNRDSIIPNTDPKIITKEQLSSIKITSQSLICGSPIDQKFASELSRAIGCDIRFDFAINAKAIAELAHNKMTSGDLESFQEVTPIYFRPPV